MVRRPHTAVISWKGEKTKDQETGDITEGKELSFEIKGRLEPNSSKATITEAGRVLNYSYKFTGEPLQGTIPINASIEVLGQKRPIIQIFKYATHCLIWL